MKYLKIYGLAPRMVVLLLVAGIIATATLFSGWRAPEPELTATAHAQSSIMLEQRLNQVEQRFNFVESRLSRLESESRSPTASIGTSRTETEISLLRAQMDTMRADIDSLRIRTGELECAVLKLDERTLTPSARAARRRGGSGEPCRANPASSITLSARQ